tara:strand:- start:419 stop:769 length:351 start_codon:yes stop_codon:yes gene_type:complete
MTIPLFLAEAIPLEIRNILKSLKRGQKARFKGDEGTINFISDQYITLSLNRREDPNTMHGYKETNLLVYPNDWDELEIEDEHFYNKKNYKGVIRDHPGNEDLPTDITGIPKNENTK